MSKPYTLNPLMTGFTEGYFETNDNTRIRYLHKGKGNTLIMIPAFDSPADIYSLNAPELAENYSVYILEMRGHGLSDAPEYGRHIFRLSADLHEFIEFLGIPKVSLLGWSMGNSVIWGYIELFGQKKLEKLIFDEQVPFLAADPYETNEETKLHGGNPVDVWHIQRAYSKDFDFGAYVTETYLGDKWELTEEIAGNLPDCYAEKMAQIPKFPIDEAHRKFLACLARDHWYLDWRSVFPRIETPVLLISGDISNCTNVESMAWIAKTVPDCTWVRFTKEDFAVHDLHQTAYKKFNRTVKEFLAK